MPTVRSAWAAKRKKNMSESAVADWEFLSLVPRDSGAVEIMGQPSLEDSLLEAQMKNDSLTATVADLTAKLQSIENDHRHAIDTMKASLVACMRKTQHHLNRQLIALSIRVAEVILRHKLPDKNMVEGVLHKTLDRACSTDGVRIRLNHADFQTFSDNSTTASCNSGLETLVDPSLKPGDVVIETENGWFDARISERLRLVQETLSERYRNTNEVRAGI